MLELISDKRSGKKLEILVPTFNEEKRILNILNYYGKDFDLIILDGNSSDKTVSIAVEQGATVFNRIAHTEADRNFSEKYVAYYVNQLTKSAYCFLLHADEFIKKEELQLAYHKLMRDNEAIISGHRMDWFYGAITHAYSSNSPRGFRKGSLIYKEGNLHYSLFYDPVRYKNKITVEVNHLTIWDMRGCFGKVSKYTYRELDLFFQNKHPYFKFFKRFIVSELFLIPKRIWKDRHRNWTYLLWLMCLNIIASLIGIICLIEKKCLLSPEQQLELYSKIYSSDKNDLA